MDRGANGGIIGNDARPFRKYQKRVDVTGIAQHQLVGLCICDAAALSISNRGPVIIILQQYAYSGKGRTIHSSGQLEKHGNKVDDRSMRIGGRQSIVTNDGYILPLDIINGLPYLPMSRDFTDKEWNELPHVVLTGGGEWDPRCLDNRLSQQENWKDILHDLDKGLAQTPFDEHGDYLHREHPKAKITIPDDDEEISIATPSSHSDSDDSSQSTLGSDDGSLLLEDDDSVFKESRKSRKANFRECFSLASNLNRRYIYSDEITETTAEETTYASSSDESDDDSSVLSGGSDDTDDLINEAQKAPKVPRQTKKTKIDYAQYRPYFLDVPVEKVRKTFENTTRYATNVVAGVNMRQTLKSPCPALNVWRRFEPVATDTIYAQVPAIGTNGQTCAQFFVGRKSRVIDIYGMGTDAEFVNTLEDVIRKRGAMDKLISDSAAALISERVKDILRALIIDNWQSEPRYQHQNWAELVYKHHKHSTQWFMSKRNIPPEFWLLCSQWTADVMNHTAEKSLKWRTPLEVLTTRRRFRSLLMLQSWV